MRSTIIVIVPSDSVLPKTTTLEGGSGFVFSTQTITTEGPSADIWYNNLEFPANGGKIIDLGNISLEEVISPPLEGYTNLVNIIAGHVYVLKITKGSNQEYIKLKVSEDWTAYSPVTFKWVYLIPHLDIEPPTDNTNARITAELDPETPEVIAGKQVSIITNLKNNRNIETTYTVSIYGNEDWSRLVSIEPQTLTLAPGESGDANIVLSINSDVEGDKEFTIKASYDTKVTEQKIGLNIEKPVKPIEERISPTLYIISPLDDYSTKSKNINFKYIPNDDSNITKCELIIDGQVKETDTSIIKGSENNFDLILSIGTYKWKIKCTDSYGNQGFSDEWDLEIRKSSSRGQSYSYSYEPPPTEIKVEKPSLNESSNEILEKQEVIRLESLKITGEKTTETQINKSMMFISFIVFALIVFTLFLIVLIIRRL